VTSLTWPASVTRSTSSLAFGPPLVMVVLQPDNLFG